MEDLEMELTSYLKVPEFMGLCDSAASGDELENMFTTNSSDDICSFLPLQVQLEIKTFMMECNEFNTASSATRCTIETGGPYAEQGSVANVDLNNIGPNVDQRAEQGACCAFVNVGSNIGSNIGLNVGSNIGLNVSSNIESSSEQKFYCTVANVGSNESLSSLSCPSSLSSPLSSSRSSPLSSSRSSPSSSPGPVITKTRRKKSAGTVNNSSSGPVRDFVPARGRARAKQLKVMTLQERQNEFELRKLRSRQSARDCRQKKKKLLVLLQETNCKLLAELQQCKQIISKYQQNRSRTKGRAMQE